MSDPRSGFRDAAGIVTEGEPRAAPSDKGAEDCAERPYLRIFGADVGAVEIQLPRRTVTIGRSEAAEISLSGPTVSRMHATITPDGDRFILADAGSTCGTLVNGRPCEKRVLEHGDSIQIAGYVLQFRTHHELPGTERAAARAKAMLQGEYCTLPSTMRLRFRTLVVDPPSVFETGDTLRIGQGGLLIPTDRPPEEAGCLELELTITESVTRRFLGSVMGVVEEAGISWICVKLHTVPREKHEAIVADAAAGPWVDVLPT